MTQKRHAIISLALILVIGVVSGQCAAPAPEEPAAEEPAPAFHEPPIESVPTDEPDEGRVWPADEELQSAIYLAIERGNEAQIEAVRTLDVEPLLETSRGAELARNEEWIAELSQSNQYVVARLDNLEINSVGVLEPEGLVVATTIEDWGELEHRDWSNDDLLGTRAPTVLYETYFMVFVDGEWKVDSIMLREELSATLVNIVGTVWVNGQSVADSVLVYPGDVIETGDDGYATLLFPDGDSTHLGAETSLELLDLEPLSARKAHGLASPLAAKRGFFARLRQKVGKTWNKFRNRKNIDSAVASATNVDTEFAVYVAEDGSTRVAVFDGTVLATSFEFPDDPVRVETGKHTLVREGFRPLEPVDIDEPLVEVEAVVVLVRADDNPPEVTINVPPADSVDDDEEFAYDGQEGGLWYKDVILQGSAFDPEDGVLSGGSLVWTTDRTDLQDAVLGTGENPTVTLYSNRCAGVWHEITLTATDSGGNATSVERRIFIWTVC